MTPISQQRLLSERGEELLQHEPFVRELARLLVGDRQQAEDLAQDAWVAALEAGTAAMHTPRGWLATVLRRLAGKHRRSRLRRLRREQFATEQQPDRAPSVDELLEREHARAAVVKAVLALPDAYRDVVVLRWFEGLPPRDVAQRLGVPVETVRTRHRRALDRLREQLDAQHGGDRAAWLAALSPLADTARSVAAATTLLGALLMLSMKTKLLTVAAAVVVIGVVTWAMSPTGTVTSMAGGGGEVVAANADTLEREREQSSGEETTTQRTAVADEAPVTDAATTGTAVIKVVWHDGTTAEDVQVMIHCNSERRSARTDHEGTVRFADLPPAQCWANIERGDLRSIEQPHFEIFAGRETVVGITIAEALLATGIVVDGDDEPIVGARILVTPTGSSSSVVIAGTGEDGRFAARDVGCWCKIHAVADGLAPSLEREITGSRGGSVELRFVLDRPSGEVVGKVLGPDHQPIAKAWVFLRSTEPYATVQLPDGSTGRQPGNAPCATDEGGGFSFAPVAVGEYSLAVRSDRFASSERRITVAAGQTSTVEVALLAGVIVRGVVRDAQGRPVAGASIEARAHYNHLEVRTERDGSYELANVPPGALHLTAGIAGPAVTLRSEALPGDVVRWDPVLPQPVVLRGRVVDHEGHPVSACSIKAHHCADGSGEWSARGTSDADGHFDLADCEAKVPMFLDVALPGSEIEVAHLAGVVPDDDELLVTLPPPTAIHLRGTIVDEQDQPLPNVQIFVFDRRQRLVLEQNRADGTFEFGPFPAGDYYLHLNRDRSKMRVPFHTIADGETWDLGRLPMPRGGSVRATLVGDGARIARDIELTYPDGEYAWSDLCRDGTAVIGSLAPGDYLLHVRGEDICNQVLPVTIRNGRDTVLDVPVHQGTPVTMPFETAEGSPLPLELRVTITDAATGARHLDTRIWDRQGLTLGTMLPPGRYRVEASGPNKMQHTLGCTFELFISTDAIERTVQLSRRD